MSFIVLIETLWNVKILATIRDTISEMVLIETLWNVKVPSPLSGASVCLVLIETLWNVKINGKTKAAITIRINRNIMECKDRCSRTG